jgi:hypothetical protein
MTVSAVEMRDFAVQCLRWSEDTKDAGQRDLIVRMAKGWMNTASALDHRLHEGMRPCGDLKRKLD